MGVWSQAVNRVLSSAGGKSSRAFVYEKNLFPFKMALYPSQHFHVGVVFITAFRHFDPRYGR